MMTLTVWKFDDASAAAEARESIASCRRLDPRAVHDLAVVSWARDADKPTAWRRNEPLSHLALDETFWGLLFGMIFFVPLIGAALGTATGARAGSLRDVGIDDRFVNRVRDEVTPGTSGLFLLGAASATAAVVPALAAHQPSERIVTVIDDEQDHALRDVFAASPRRGPRC